MLAALACASGAAFGEDVAKPPPQPEPVPVEARGSAPVVRVYGLFGQGLLTSLPSTGSAHFRDWATSGFKTGVGNRTTPLFTGGSLIDLEAGVVILDRVRIGGAIESPLGVFSQVWLGHVGYDFAHLALPRATQAVNLTVWADGGYEKLHGFPANGSKLNGPFAGARLSLEYRAGYFLLRADLFARVQLATEYDEENDGEGNYASFPTPLPLAQFGLKLGVGLAFPK